MKPDLRKDSLYIFACIFTTPILLLLTLVFLSSFSLLNFHPPLKDYGIDSGILFFSAFALSPFVAVFIVNKLFRRVDRFLFIPLSYYPLMIILLVFLIKGQGSEMRAEITRSAMLSEKTYGSGSSEYASKKEEYDREEVFDYCIDSKLNSYYKDAVDVSKLKGLAAVCRIAGAISSSFYYLNEAGTVFHLATLMNPEVEDGGFVEVSFEAKFILPRVLVSFYIDSGGETGPLAKRGMGLYKFDPRVDSSAFKIIDLSRIYLTRDTSNISAAALLFSDFYLDYRNAGNGYYLLQAVSCVGCEAFEDSVLVEPVSGKFKKLNGQSYGWIDARNLLFFKERHYSSNGEFEGIDYPVYFEKTDFQVFNIETWEERPYPNVLVSDLEAMRVVKKTLSEGETVGYPLNHDVIKNTFWEIPVLKHNGRFADETPLRTVKVSTVDGKILQ